MEKDYRLWELLAKRSAGEAGEEELRELNTLLKPFGNDIYYMTNVMDHYWEKVNTAEENSYTLQHTAELKDHVMGGVTLQSPIEHASAGKNNIKDRRFFYWSSAAIVVLCIAIGWLMWNPFQHISSDMNTVTVKDGVRKKIALPDGSEVWLNGGSKLTYSKNLNHCGSREISLSGEGYFKVKHNNNCPFIIHTDYLDIKDLGTVFNVKAYPDEKEAVATLISGSIEVSIKEDPGRTIILKPHEKVSYFADIKGLTLNKNSEGNNDDLKGIESIHPIALHNNRMEVSHIQPVVNTRGDTIVAETAWVNNELVFQGEKFSQLAESMQRWYNVKIRIENEQVANYTFTGIFNGESLVEALNELKMIRTFGYEINQDTVVIE